MNMLRAFRFLALGLAALLPVLHSGTAMAQSPPLPTPTCAWPLAWTPFGMGNWALPDTANRWWYMPIDPKWSRLTLTGTYPNARFFSIAVYNDAPVSTGLAEHLYDAQIVPDPGAGNPFVPGPSYTITVVTPTSSGSSTGNVLKLTAASGTGWLVYRLYLPDAGGTSMGDAPLPEVRITDAAGSTTLLQACPYLNRRSEVARVQQEFLPPGLETPTLPPPVPDHILFGTIDPPPARLLPNPDNKYLGSFFLPAYQPDRIIVLRGKAPAFPDTYHGSSIWDPAPGFDAVQVRFWSICLADFVSPLPGEGCAVDASTPLDRKGFYTIVISNDVLRPAWLPEKVVWLPWGDEQMVPKLMFVRHLVSAPDFKNAVQNAAKAGCGIAFNLAALPTQEEITTSAHCTQQVMGDYYPVAAWCDVETFRSGGWHACFRAAQVQ